MNIHNPHTFWHFNESHTRCFNWFIQSIYIIVYSTMAFVCVRRTYMCWQNTCFSFSAFHLTPCIWMYCSEYGACTHESTIYIKQTWLHKLKIKKTTKLKRKMVDRKMFGVYLFNIKSAIIIILFVCAEIQCSMIDGK